MSDTERVLSQEITHLRAESEKLRALFEVAYREGWLDGSEAIPARKLHMVKDWNNSAAAAAIRESRNCVPEEGTA